jgi:hypothetical protein
MAKNVIPEDLEKVLTVDDINKTFMFMEAEFQSKQYRLDYHSQYLHNRKKIVNELEFFSRYMITHVEPVLKQLLRRKDHVTFAIIRYLLEDRLENGKGKMSINRK